MQWTPTKQLEDLDYADDTVLLSHTQRQMQEKTTRLNSFSKQTGLHIHRDKSKVLKIHPKATDPIMLNNEDLETTRSFTYLGSIIYESGGTEADIVARIGKARAAFQQLSNIWRSSRIHR